MAIGSPAHATSNSHKAGNNALRRNATSNSSSNNNNRARGINSNNSKSANHVTSSNVVDDFLDNGNYSDWGSKGTASPNSDVMQDVSLIQQIAAKAASSTALVAPTVALTVYIPTSTVGAVIGRKGQTIAQLQKISAEKASSNHPVRISVVGRDYLNNNGHIITQNGVSMFDPSVNNNSQYGLSNNNNSGNASSSGSIPYTHTELDWSNPSLTPVVIRADPAASIIAATILHDIVVKQQQQILQQQSSGTTANGSLGIGKVNYGQENGEEDEDGEYYSYEDDVILDVPISRHKHAAIVGKRGIVLATISADYGVRVMVPPPPLPSSLATLSSERHDIIQLEGSLSNVKRCFLKILQLASAAYNNNNVANKATDTKVDDNKSMSNNNKKTQPNGVTKYSTTENASATNVVDGIISHQKTIVLTVPIPQAKLRNIGQKTDTTIRKKKKVEDGFSYAVTSSLNTNSNGSTNGTVLTIHQQKMIVENNVNAAVALLQKWNSDNLTSAAAANVAGTQSSTVPANNPGSDSSSTGPRSPRRTNNNNRNRSNGGRGMGANNNKNGPNKRVNNKSRSNKETK